MLKSVNSKLLFDSALIVFFRIYASVFAVLICLWGGVANAQSSLPSLPQMAAQMIVVGFSGNDISDAGVQSALDDIANERIGGVMFLGVNVASEAATKQMTAAFQNAAPGLPPLITIDQEGGLVERLTRKVGFPEVAKPEEIANGSIEQAQQIYGGMARGLQAWGFNTNFGPVVDLNVNPQNPIIARFGRSYSADSMKVVAYSNAFINAHRQADVLTALKHFPGHGSSQDDSHEGFVDISNSWSRAELGPFARLAQSGQADMVMVGHLFADVLGGGDSATYPASLSNEWIDGELRQELGFHGVVITDDMEMGAIRQHYGFEQSIVRAVRAGVDILLFSNTANNRTTLGAEILQVLLDEVDRDPEFSTHIIASYMRIAAMKQGLN